MIPLPPCHFQFNGKINFLKTPSEYLKTCQSLIKTSKRAHIGSLYFGTGKKSEELLNTIRSAQLENNYQVAFYLDNQRGKRLSNNISSQLFICNTLDQELSSITWCHPHLSKTYYTVPPLSEIFGTFHCKFQLFDDSTLILTGANCSDSYFTNRQDRWLVLKDENKTCSNIISQITDQLNLFGSFKSFNSFDTSQERFTTGPTTLVPFLQYGQHSLNEFTDYLETLFTSIAGQADIYISTGYLNMSEKLQNLLKYCRSKNSKIFGLTASPSANSFYQAPGPKKYVSEFYIWSLKQHEMLFDELYVYSRQDWTFHSKGIWIVDKTSNRVLATVIGSSNYGIRSENRDLEFQMLVTTEDSDIQMELDKEWKHLWVDSQSQYIASPDFTESQYDHSWFIPLIAPWSKSFF